MSYPMVYLFLGYLISVDFFSLLSWYVLFIVIYYPYPSTLCLYFCFLFFCFFIYGYVFVILLFVSVYFVLLMFFIYLPFCDNYVLFILYPSYLFLLVGVFLHSVIYCLSVLFMFVNHFHHYIYIYIYIYNLPWLTL